MDWKGLLNWTLNYNDGTINKDLKPMTEEDQKFIQDALESVTINEMKEIFKILDTLKELYKDNYSENEIKVQLDLYDELLNLIEGTENARNIVRCKRFIELIDYFFNTNNKQIKLCIANIIGSMMQNDKYIQHNAIQLGIFKILGLINEANNSDDKELLSKYIFMLTGILYGEGETSKRLFLEEYDGMKLIFNLLIKNYKNEDQISAKIYLRLLNILKELTKIENKEAENYKIRQIAINKIKGIDLHKLLIEIVHNSPIDNNRYEFIKLILDIFLNIIKIYDNLEQVFALIEYLNKKLPDSPLDPETIKQEKMYLISVIKKLKSEFSKNENLEINSQLSGGDKPLAIGCEPSMHIEIKK